MTRHWTLEYDDDLLFATGMSPAEFGEQAAFLLAAKNSPLLACSLSC